MELSRPLAVVTPTLDGDVLRVLALADAEFTAREVHDLLPARTKRGIDKVLERLVLQGIVTHTHVGRPNLYRLNRDHLAAPAIEILARQKQGLVERMRQSLALWSPPPVYAALFGSAARHDHSVNSDIDIFLVAPDGVDEDNWTQHVMDFTDRVQRWTGNDARAISFAENDVTGKAAHNPLFTDVARDAIVVHGDVNWLRNVLREREES